jgi:hypothetical protein
VICRANPFYGHSHFSEARNAEYLIKTLGAGRIPPGEGLQFIAENAKANDLVSVGFGAVDEVTESVELAEKLL